MSGVYLQIKKFDDRGVLTINVIMLNFAKSFSINNIFLVYKSEVFPVKSKRNCKLNIKKKVK